MNTPECACSHCVVKRARQRQEWIDQLRKADFALGYAWRDDAEESGYVTDYRITGEWSGGCRLLTVNEEDHASYGQPYVSFGRVATDNCSYGNSSSVEESNFRSIMRDFPDFPWFNTSHRNVNALGCFVSDLTQDMVNLMIGLVEQYSIYDESDLSDLESDQISESWGQYVKADLWRDMNEVTRTIVWDGLGGDDAVEELFWECVSHDVFGNYPEHAGVEVRWGDMADRVKQFRPYLIRAFVSKRRGDVVAPGWVGKVAEHAREARYAARKVTS